MLTPTIALIAAGIAIWQARVNANRLKLELFERRVGVHDAVRRIYSVILRDTYCLQSDLGEFRIAIQDAHYLFGKEITSYLDEWWKHATALYVYHDAIEQLRGDPEGASKRSEYRKTMESSLDWTMKQAEIYPKKFEKYLRPKSGFFS